MSSLAKSPMAEPAVRRAVRRMPARNADALLQSLEKSVERAREHLLHLQKPDGHWFGELQGDTILESEYILLMAFLGRESDDRRPQGGPLHPHAAAARRRLEQLSRRAGRSQRLGQGVLRPEARRPRRRRAVHAPRPATSSATRGGADQCNSFTKFYLALLGQFPYANCAVGAAGDDVPAALGLRQHLRDVELDADDRRAAEHLLGASSRCGDCRRTRGIRELFLEDAADAALAAARRRKRLAHAGRTSSSASIRLYKKLASAGARSWLRRRRVARPPRWMLRPLRRQRRPRRDLPADDLHDHQPALPRLCRRLAGDDLGAASSSTT